MNSYLCINIRPSCFILSVLLCHFDSGDLLMSFPFCITLSRFGRPLSTENRRRLQYKHHNWQEIGDKLSDMDTKCPSKTGFPPFLPTPLIYYLLGLQCFSVPDVLLYKHIRAWQERSTEVKNCSTYSWKQARFLFNKNVRIKTTSFDLCPFHYMFLKYLKYCLFTLEIGAAELQRQSFTDGVINLISHFALQTEKDQIGITYKWIFGGSVYKSFLKCCEKYNIYFKLCCFQ